MNPFRLIYDFFFGMYEYREFLRQSVQRDLRRRYRRAFLGYIWSMLQPLMMMAVLTVAFAKIMNRTSDDYAVFLFAGMIPFSYFKMTVMGAMGAVRQNAQITDQIPVPRFIFPTSYGISNLVDLIFSILPLLLVMLVLGHPFHKTLLLFPIVLVPLFLCTMGLAFIFAVSNVFFEDTEHLVGVLLQALYFLSPVLYAREQLPDWVLKYVEVFNPMFIIVELHRSIFYDGLPINWMLYGQSVAIGLVLLAFGIWVFKRAEKKFIYFL